MANKMLILLDDVINKVISIVYIIHRKIQLFYTIDQLYITINQIMTLILIYQNTRQLISWTILLLKKIYVNLKLI